MEKEQGIMFKLPVALTPARSLLWRETTLREVANMTPMVEREAKVILKTALVKDVSQPAGTRSCISQ